MNKLPLLLIVFALGCGSKKTSDQAMTDTASAQPSVSLALSADSIDQENNPQSVDETPPPSDEAGPVQLDAEKAVSPIYSVSSPNCQEKDDQGSEGDEFVRKCPGYGNYSLWASGFDDQVNYRIESDDPKDEFFVMLFPLETDQAAAYVRADQFVQKLDGQIEWQLDPKGKPYAVIVRSAFYKNLGDVNRSVRPQNKVAEFLLVRGLSNHRDLQYDIPTTDTPYNPVEQARMLAYKALEKAGKN